MGPADVASGFSSTPLNFPYVEHRRGRSFKFIERERDINVGLFAIKPSVYEFEREVRAILYPKRELLCPLEVPHPNISGFSLPLNPEVDDTRSIFDFIESVYVHPMLEEDSLTVHAVIELNRRFDLADLRVVADKIEALGNDVTLP